MALDFIIEKNKKYGKDYLPVGTQTHWEIYNLAKSLNLPLISRISNYYSDYAFKLEELGELLSEIDKILENIGVDHQINFLKDLRELVLSAINQKSDIIVRSD